MTFALSLGAEPAQLGDLDEDGVFTANDLAMLVGHSAGRIVLLPALEPFADLTQDGFINEADHAALVSLILESATPQMLPLASIREVSPSTGEGDVAVSRETVLHFSMPLALNTALDTTKLYAEFGGRKILSRVEVSSDKKKATLFYLEPLPSNARVQVSFDSTGVNDLLGRAIDGNGDGTVGGTYTTTFDTLSITAVAGTAISGRVFASDPGQGVGGATVDVPLAGVTVTVDGAEQTLRATTDAQGNFTLNPCPAGSFFVHVDGRTSPQSNYPNGDYYPSVGKRWEAIAGRTDNLSGNPEDTSRGTIYLPKVLGSAMAVVSQVQDTEVEFPASVIEDNPELAGTELKVPANSLFADDGTRGGRVGIAAVAPDRLPSPLPPGLDLPMVITIQTDGATNFDRPVPITFPNIPDRITGEKLPPGAKSALWSFNHDLGDWEVVGPMTVSEDGEFVTTDAGVGVRQPGWHGQRPGTTGDGPPPPNVPPPPPCDPANPPFGPCSSDPTQNNRNRAACFASGTAGVAGGVIVRYVMCKVPGAPKIFKALCKVAKKADVTDPILAAQLSKRCQQYYLDCNLTPGEPPAIQPCPGGMQTAIASNSIAPSLLRKKQVSGLSGSTKAEANIQTFTDAYMDLSSEMNALSADLALLDEVYDQAAIVIGDIEDPSDLSPDQLKQLLDLELVLDSITGGRSEEDYLKPRMAAIDHHYRRLLTDGGLTSNERAYYYMENIETGFVQRGRTAPGGGLQSLILPANTNFVIRRWFAGQAYVTTGYFRSAESGTQTAIPVGQQFSDGIDADNDGLGEVAESILGTNKLNSDTDGDGITDGAEVQQGTNPLNGFIATTGIVASVPTTAPATDIHALDNVAVTANGSNGVSVFNVLSGLNPTRIADVDTPGIAVAVAGNGDYVAVADYLSGLAIVDISNPAAVRISAQVNVGASVQSVAVNGGLALAGTTTGQIVTVDLATATVLGRVNLPGGAVIQDLTVWRDTLYALQVGKLTALDLNTLAIQGSLNLSGSMGAGQRRWRMFAGEGTLYATHTSGFNIVDTGTNPSAPTLVQNVNTSQFGWKQIVANGSGLGIAAVSPNSTDDGPHNIDLYTLGANQRTPAFGTTFETPGLAAAVSIYNGLAYVADSSSGLQVLSYLPYDNQGQAPAISLNSNFSLNTTDKTGTAEEGKLMRLSAAVTDDVQVRNVEFYVDGQSLITDGNYPFEHRFPTPAISSGSPNFKVKAKTTDTGGNVAWSDEFTITLVPDATPPQVLAVSPGNNAITGALTSLYASFNEPMNPATLATGFSLTEAGPDKAHGTADDVVNTGEVSYRENTRTAFMAFASPGLQPGLYRITLQSPAADGAGNAIATPFVSSFRVYNASMDTDGDGVPDEYESLLGLNPTRDDTDNDGILDGNEDYDSDGLKNSAEFYLQTNPMIADTNGNGIFDGNEDTDLDGLNDGLEDQYGTNALLMDSDGDGFDDATEIAEGSDPNVGSQKPLTRVRSSMVSILNAAHQDLPANLAYSAASKAVSYLNSTTEPLPGNLANAAASRAVSYLNAATEQMPVALDNTAASKAVSYLNSASEPMPASRDAQSGQVSYRNNP